MTIALDPGAHELRSLRCDAGRLVARRSPAAAAAIDDNAARRRWLKATRIPHLATENCLVIPGEAAEEAKGLCESLPADLLPGGELPESDPVTRQVVASLVEALLPRGQHRGSVCCFAQSGHDESATAGQAVARHKLEFLTQLIHLRGYQATPLNPATALVLAELSSAGFSGVGLVLGASGCDLAVVHCGKQIACARLARGGRWIDEQVARRHQMFRRDAAGINDLDLDEARAQKVSVSLRDPTTGVGLTVARLYRELVQSLIDKLAALLLSRTEIALLRQPLPVIAGGGPAQIDGFVDLLGLAINDGKTRITLRAPRVASEPVYSVARGCLIRACIEEAGSGEAASRKGRPLRHSAAPR